MPKEILRLLELSKDQVPADLTAAAYFDFEAHPFAHQSLIENANSVYGAILGINAYATQWLGDTIAVGRSSARVLKNEAPSPAYTIGNFEVILEEGAVFAPARVIGSRNEGVCYAVYVAKGADLTGCDLYVNEGSVYIGIGTTVEPCVGIKGPTIIGADTEIRQGAYLRGDCILGDGCVIRGEIKNSVLMDRANFPHPSYLGDSLCGYMTHFGNQATTANIGIFAGLVPSDERKPLVIDCEGTGYDLGKPKMGICMGDFCQVGCNSVSDPGTFMKPYTIVYTLTRISKGIYGPKEILKNKPVEHGVVERTPLR